MVLSQGSWGVKAGSEQERRGRGISVLWREPSGCSVEGEGEEKKLGLLWAPCGPSTTSKQQVHLE